jgi:hypothetical protein
MGRCEVILGGIKGLMAVMIVARVMVGMGVWSAGRG